MGDMNSDVTRRPGGTAHKGKQLLSMLRRYGLKNMIKNPTRTTQFSETIIDLIITSNKELILNSGTFDTGIADHSLIFATLKIRKDRVPPRYQKVSNMSKCDWASFNKSLEEVPWHVCDIFDDVDGSVWAWTQLYKNVRKDYIKERYAKVRSKTLPWMNGEIRKEMNKRYKLLKKAKTTKRETDWLAYKSKKNAVTNMLRKAEQKHWEESLNDAHGKGTKSFWKVVKKLNGKNKKETIGPIENDEGQAVFDDKVKADLFNDFFTNIGPDLASKFPDTQSDDRSYIENITPNTMQITTDVKTKLKESINKLQTGKATGLDGVTANEIKNTSNVFIESFERICLKSIQTCKYPSEFKKAKLKAAYKKGGKPKRENYIPLSMLSTPGKLMESIVCSSIDDHSKLVPNNNQWGFKKHYSTELLLLYLTELWTKSLDEGQAVGVIFIDFRKAFDTVDHVVLDKKLQSSGIAGDFAEWIHDYLQCRKQQTQIGEAMSNFQQITYGVPQGSLLGPRLFSIYTRDLPGAVISGHIQMYADGTTAYVIEDSVDNVCIALQRTLNEIQEWCGKHKLTIHPDKTKAMILNRQKFTGPLPQLKF